MSLCLQFLQLLQAFEGSENLIDFFDAFLGAFAEVSCYLRGL
jgi:hypothetical protein